MADSSAGGRAITKYSEAAKARILASKAQQEQALFKAKYPNSRDYNRFVQAIHEQGAQAFHTRPYYQGANGEDGQHGDAGGRGDGPGDDGLDGIDGMEGGDGADGVAGPPTCTFRAPKEQHVCLLRLG